MGHLEYIGLLSYVGLPNVDILSQHIKKSHFLNSPHIESEKSKVLESCQAHSGKFKSSKS